MPDHPLVSNHHTALRLVLGAICLANLMYILAFWCELRDTIQSALAYFLWQFMSLVAVCAYAHGFVDSIKPNLSKFIEVRAMIVAYSLVLLIRQIVHRFHSSDWDELSGLSLLLLPIALSNILIYCILTIFINYWTFVLEDAMFNDSEAPNLPMISVGNNLNKSPLAPGELIRVPLYHSDINYMSTRANNQPPDMPAPPPNYEQQQHHQTISPPPPPPPYESLNSN